MCILAVCVPVPGLMMLATPLANKPRVLHREIAPPVPSRRQPTDGLEITPRGHTQIAPA